MTQSQPHPSDANPIQAPGTDESHWRAWGGWHRLPETRLPASGRAVVVSAHPDDGVLGAGGTIALLADAGVELTVVSVTDGERSHPESRIVRPQGLAQLRAGELHEALAELGAGEARVVRLQVPDSEVAFHEDDVARALETLLAGASLCLAPWIGDLQGDHEAAGRAALAACRTARVPCRMYPVWMWHWARPDDPALPWPSAGRTALPEPVAARKRAAVERFASQLRPLGPGPENAAILPPEEIAHHLRDVEVVFE